MPSSGKWGEECRVDNNMMSPHRIGDPPSRNTSIQIRYIYFFFDVRHRDEKKYLLPTPGNLERGTWIKRDNHRFANPIFPINSVIEMNGLLF